MKRPKLLATLFVKYNLEPGRESFFTWLMFLFNSYPPYTACGDLAGSGEFASQKEAAKKAEHYAKLLGIKIDRRA